MEMYVKTNSFMSTFSFFSGF